MGIQESSYRSVVVVTPRRKHHPDKFNCFEWNVADHREYNNPLLKDDNKVREQATLQVIISRK